MRWLINYIRSCFCKHDWELLDKANVYMQEVSLEIPYERRWTYRCKKCGQSNVIKTA